MSWAMNGAPSAPKPKTMLDLQVEEMEGRLTSENLKRLQEGRKPTHSPLLEKMRMMQHSQGHAPEDLDANALAQLEQTLARNERHSKDTLDDHIDPAVANNPAGGKSNGGVGGKGSEWR
jgi:hypothetical protein